MTMIKSIWSSIVDTVILNRSNEGWTQQQVQGIQCPPNKQNLHVVQIMLQHSTQALNQEHLLEIAASAPKMKQRPFFTGW